MSKNDNASTTVKVPNFKGMTYNQAAAKANQIGLNIVKAEDGKQIVSKYVDEVAKANNANIKIKGFVRFVTGEGIEKWQEDY